MTPSELDRFREHEGDDYPMSWDDFVTEVASKYRYTRGEWIGYGLLFVALVAVSYFFPVVS